MGELSRYTDADGRCFQAIPLIAVRGRAARMAAVLAVEVASGPRSMPTGELLSGIAHQLLEHCDVAGVVLSTEPLTNE